MMYCCDVVLLGVADLFLLLVLLDALLLLCFFVTGYFMGVFVVVLGVTVCCLAIGVLVSLCISGCRCVVLGAAKGTIFE